MSNYSGIGVLGGSFNPVHKGHVFLAGYVREHCHLETVLMIPTGVHPFSSKRENIPEGRHRLEMLRLAIGNTPGIEVSDIEVRKEEPSYTYVTLTELRAQYGPDCPIHFIVGTDELLELDRWYRFDGIVKEFGLIVGIRPHYERERIMDRVKWLEEEYGAKIQLMDLPAPDVSSTQVRNALKNGEDVSGLIEEDVLRYIRENGLYRSEEETTMDREQILALLQQRLKPSRLKHTLGVRDMAVELAKIHGADVQKAETAALLHDFCKNLSVEESNALIKKYHLDERYLDNTALAHSQTAAAVLEQEYHITDPEILNAIRCHTVGKPGMTLLEQIVYAADALEPGRSFPGVDTLREAARENLSKACSLVRDETIRYLIAKGEEMDNKAIAWKVAEVIDSKKGQDITLIDISRTSGFADYFVITHAPSERLMKTISDEVEDKLAELGVFLKHSEGKNGSGWILMDFGDIIVNVFTGEQRERYNLERIWGDCEITRYERTEQE